MIRARKGLTAEIFGQIMRREVPADAVLDAEMIRLLARMDSDDEKRETKGKK